MRIDKNLYGEGSARVCGFLVLQDTSGGQGHCWETIHQTDLPANVQEEIEGEIIDGGKDVCHDYTASNGEHYSW